MLLLNKTLSGSNFIIFNNNSINKILTRNTSGIVLNTSVLLSQALSFDSGFILSSSTTKKINYKILIQHHQNYFITATTTTTTIYKTKMSDSKSLIEKSKKLAASQAIDENIDAVNSQILLNSTVLSINTKFKAFKLFKKKSVRVVGIGSGSTIVYAVERLG
jgi:hypothetical protein